jgi:hypothetical protein
VIQDPHPAAHVLSAPGDAWRAGAGDPGTGRAPGSRDDVALHAPEPGGAGRRDRMLDEPPPALGSTEALKPRRESVWRNRRESRGEIVEEAGKSAQIADFPKDLEAAGVELDRLSEYGLILKNASKSETLETVESLKICFDPQIAPAQPRRTRTRGASEQHVGKSDQRAATTHSHSVSNAQRHTCRIASSPPQTWRTNSSRLARIAHNRVVVDSRNLLHRSGVIGLCAAQFAPQPCSRQLPVTHDGLR